MRLIDLERELEELSFGKEELDYFNVAEFFEGI